MSADPSPDGVPLEIDALQLGPIGTNCYVVRVVGSRHALVVDPGDDPSTLLEHLRERDLLVDAILVTHCHYDHVGAVAPLVDATGAPVWMSLTEAPVLEQPEQFAVPGMPQVAAATVDHRLEGDERIDVAGIAFDVLSVPGHSPGHLAFLAPGMADPSGGGFERPPICFIGDVVFRGSVGRTDLPFADGATLARTLEMLQQRLHPDTVLLSGHGEATTMAAELRSNPFLRS